MLAEELHAKGEGEARGDVLGAIHGGLHGFLEKDMRLGREEATRDQDLIADEDGNLAVAVSQEAEQKSTSSA
jgi:hypothetical protein